MGNSVLNNRRNVPQSPSNVLNPQLLNQFNQFRQMFTGNPQQTVMNMLQQGKMTNEQFQQFYDHLQLVSIEQQP